MRRTDTSPLLTLLLALLGLAGKDKMCVQKKSIIYDVKTLVQSLSLLYGPFLPGREKHNPIITISTLIILFIFIRFFFSGKGEMLGELFFPFKF